MLSYAFRRSLFWLQVVAVLTMLRSIAFDRWITVATSLLLILGGVAAGRGRTWGVALALAAAAWFPIAFAIGIAPPWFCLVGIAGALPFLLTMKSMARFDKGATALLVALAGALGGTVAVGWKAFAQEVFEALPPLRPSLFANHGLAVLATAIGAIVLLGRSRRRQAEAEPVRARIHEPREARSRIAQSGGEAEEDEEAFAEGAAPEHRELKLERAQMHRGH